MAFGGDVDTLSLTFDKLQYIFNGYGQIRDSFIETNTIHKEGKISDAEFFDLIQLGIMRFSALEFLAIKAIFEIKKSMDRDSGIAKTDVVSGISSASSDTAPGHSITSFISAKSLPQHHSSARQETKNCIQCGNQISVKSKFCTNCGKKIPG